MNRRGFLKGVSAGVVLAALPIKPFAAYPSNAIVSGGSIIDNGRRFGDLIIDLDARTIAFTQQAAEKGLTLDQIYAQLKDAWRRDLLHSPFPMMAITPEFAEMQNDWSFDWSRAEAFKMGCIKELNGDKMTAMIGLGNYDSGDLLLARNNLQRCELVNQDSHVVRIRPDDKKFTWLATKGTDPMYDAYATDPDWRISSRYCEADTEQLGFHNLYHQVSGSLRFVKPFGKTWEPYFTPEPNRVTRL